MRWKMRTKKFYVYVYTGRLFATIIGPYKSQDEANHMAERYLDTLKNKK